MKKQTGLFLILASMALVGCEADQVIYVSDTYPTRPTGVTSTTGDGAVFLYWDPNGEPDLDFYRVYSGPAATGQFDPIGSTSGESFVDNQVNNGQTYYYAISAVNTAGLESALSVENVFDTPRPEGYGLRLYDLADQPSMSGFDLSAWQRVAYDDPSVDIFIDQDLALGLLYINAANANTDLQDMGYTDNLDDITWSPDAGWSPVGWAQVILGHTYVIWTDNNHYAKLRAVSVAGTWAQFDWAYQVDPGNPELVKPAHDSEYLGRPAAPRPGIQLSIAN
jgi:hypothetical protein